MRLKPSPSEKAFREEVRDWLHTHVPHEARPPEGEEMRQFDLEWQHAQYVGGWAGIAWPAEHGGRGLSLIEQLIWSEEYVRAKAPWIGCLFVALNHGGPTLIKRGTEAQKAFHLPRILKGEAVWCQGFSEPGAGSDLAAISARGRVEGDDLVVNGQKTWTSFGHVADFQELLIRTNPESTRHRGMTWAICDMRTPGITVTPIVTMAGHVHFCDVFYDDVRIPLSNVVGELHGGWSTAMTTLSFERGTALIGWQLELAEAVDQLIAMARTRRDHYGSLLIEHGHLFRRLAQARAETAALRALAYETLSLAERGDKLPAGPVGALYFSELAQRVHALALDILGPDSLVRDDGQYGQDWPGQFLEAFRHTIAGGTSEIRRTIIGERMLGLPREAR